MSNAAKVYPAPAKLNLMLKVVGRRADGYHLLQTVFRLIDRCDELQFNVRTDGLIERRNDVPGVCPDDDLSVRAARLLKARSGTRLGADITVAKRLPMGGGLGGGSSDAATTLIALNRLWQLRLSRRALQEMALELGADVPVFVFGAAALGEGIGEKLTALELPPAWYLVLEPPVMVATAAIFQDADLKRDSKPFKIPPFSEAMRGNDLGPVVCRRYPEVAKHLAWLGQFGSAAITGSGACVFAEFATEREAREVLERLPETMHGFVARGLDRHPLCSELT
jgi:4-diphosphocytidyl-2-C-methyl-D-erythritol kinase